MIRLPKKTLLLALCLLLFSCESIRFYTQAIGGQLSIFSNRRDIQVMINDPDTEAGLRSRLESILVIRAFAESSLDLPVAKNFSTYVDLERSFVLWNVFAAPEFSMTPVQWCYPVAGCVTYRGYFTEANAHRFAEKLAAEGKDVYVGGVAAYSTLGWFSDPVLNTLINRDEFRLAALIFHELAHQVVYVPGDTQFNESFATAVELEGLQRWLEVGGNVAHAEDVMAMANMEKIRRNEFVALVQRYVPLLEAVYASSMNDAHMREEKHRLIAAMREDYRVLKQDWQGYAVYDGWFATDINNAKISTVSTYFNRVPAFTALLADSGHDLPVFYERAQALAKLPRTARDAALDALSRTATGPVQARINHEYAPE
jgi:predicted aminopeptidase